MSQIFKNSYFHLLPREVLIKILCNVDTFTLLNFCAVYDCDYFLQYSCLTKTIDLYKKYALKDLDLLSKKINFEHVTTLNVNSLYWIQAEKLRKFVTELVNLETLYAIQTNLSLTFSDTEAFSKSKIKKLGISVNRNDELGPHKVSTVQTLYVNIFQVTSVTSAALNTIFPEVRKLWIDVERPYNVIRLLHSLNVETKRKFFCQSYCRVPFYIDLNGYPLTVYYSKGKAYGRYVMCCEKFCPELRSGSLHEVEATLGVSFQVLEELLCCKPYGPKDARRLFTNEQILGDFFFEELNFNHHAGLCDDRARKAVSKILKSPKAKHITKLCMTVCLLLNNNARQAVDVQDSVSFTRKRIGIENSAAPHPVEEVFKNFLGLRHLETFSCEQTLYYSAVQAYPLISLFEKLTSLTLEIPITVDGSFLVEVFKKCKCLERLKIGSSTPHPKLNFNILNVLPSATSLKDFCYHTDCIPVDALIESLCLIRSEKLERLVLISSKIDKFSARPLKTFLELNPQLILLYFVIHEIPEVSVQMAQETLYPYKEKHPAKVFLVKQREFCMWSRDGSLPDVHVCEMLKIDSNIARLCATEDFQSF